MIFNTFKCITIYSVYLISEALSMLQLLCKMKLYHHCGTLFYTVTQNKAIGTEQNCLSFRRYQKKDEPRWPQDRIQHTHGI